MPYQPSLLAGVEGSRYGILNKVQAKLELEAGLEERIRLHLLRAFGIWIEVLDKARVEADGDPEKHTLWYN